MANKDIIVSTEQGTILNYFGVANTYNPFTNENSMQLVEDLDFQIPYTTANVKDEFIAVSTGLITTSINFTNNCVFQIVDKKSGTVITELQNIVGEIGNQLYLPNINQIFWFNVDSLRGTFYVSKKHLGQKLKIVRGLFITTSITSGVLNDMFARTTGVPKYIQDINKLLLPAVILKNVSLLKIDYIIGVSESQFYRSQTVEVRKIFDNNYPEYKDRKIVYFIGNVVGNFFCHQIHTRRVNNSNCITDIGFNSVYPMYISYASDGYNFADAYYYRCNAYLSATHFFQDDVLNVNVHSYGKKINPYRFKNVSSDIRGDICCFII